MTSPIDQIRRYHPELTDIRHDIHAHPELGLEEHRTAELVARKLEEWGIEVHRNVGTTGVVGVLRSGNGEATIGLRADMDALPIIEDNDLPYASQNHGKMHACGHDGHTTMLLGAARYLAETRNFNGTVNFIFQPGEEGVGGALAMLEDDLFQRFPCNAVYGMHNRPGMPVGKFGISPGTAMAGGGFFDINITGKGAHGARPEESIDPVLVACHIGAALQSIVSRTVPPRDMAIVSVTRILSGDAYNVIPQTATLGGITLYASPDRMRVTLTIAMSRGGTLRETMDCSAAPMWQATSTGSIDSSGRAPCAPLPVMLMSKKPPPAIAVPGAMPNLPTGIPGRLCMPYTALHGKRANRSSFSMASAPPTPSSPGWKMKFTVPLKLRVSAR